MGNRRKLGAVIIATVLGVGVAVAVGGPQVASAVSGAPSPWWAAAPGHGGGPKGPPEGAAFDAAAKVLGVSTDELRADLEAGKTIAQIATDKGVDVNAVVDAMVAAAQPDLRQHITDLVNHAKPAHDDKGPHGKPPDLEAAAQALGLSPDDLETQLHSGKSIAQIATDKGVDLNAVITAIVNAHAAEIDADVAAGKITRAEADEHKADLKEHVTDMVNKTPPPPHGPKDHGPDHH
jgi:hypothetical protein